LSLFRIAGIAGLSLLPAWSMAADGLIAIAGIDLPLKALAGLAQEAVK
jgi:hypothetical protein